MQTVAAKTAVVCFKLEIKEITEQEGGTELEDKTSKKLKDKCSITNEVRDRVFHLTRSASMHGQMVT